jgi:uncharacterized protein YciI
VESAKGHFAPIDPAGWNVTALLWLCIMGGRFQFLHIPKTGGTSIEELDQGSTHTLVEQVWPMAWSAPMAGPARRTRRGRLFLGFRTCGKRASARPNCATGPDSLFHMTPHDLALCGLGGAWNPYAGRGRLTYCVVRDPLDRLMSDVLFMNYTGMGPASGRLVTLPGATLPVSCRSSAASSLLGLLRCHLETSRDTMQIFHTRLVARLKLLKEEANMVLGGPTSGSDGTGSASTEAAGTVKATPPEKLPSFTEFLVHTQPQHRYVTDPRGDPSCDLVFGMHHLAAAGIPRLKSRAQSYRSPRYCQFSGQHCRPVADKAAAAMRHFLSADPELRTLASSLYSADARLWQRVRDNLPPSPQHESLHSHIAAAASQLPEFFRRPPNCGPAQCTCAACCNSPGGKTRSRAQCIACHLREVECGGLGRTELKGPASPVLSRAVAPICITPWCNVCEACCIRTPRVRTSDANASLACYECERQRCDGERSGQQHIASWQGETDEFCRRFPSSPPYASYHGTPKGGAYAVYAEMRAGSRTLHNDTT